MKSSVGARKQGFSLYQGLKSRIIFKKAVSWVLLVSYLHMGVFSSVVRASETVTVVEEPGRDHRPQTLYIADHVTGPDAAFRHIEDPGFVAQLLRDNPGVSTNLSHPD